MAAVQKEEAHVAMVPQPAQGHVIPMMRLACRLASFGGISITFFCSQRFVSSALACLEQQFEHLISVVSVPKGTIDDSLWKGNAATVIRMMEAAREMEDLVEQGLKQLMNEGASVRCVIADAFLDWIQDVADRLRLPRVALWTSNTSYAIVNFLANELVDANYLPSKDKLPDRGEEIVQGMPGLGNVRLKSMPFAYYDCPEQGIRYRGTKAKSTREAACVLVSTFEELEMEALAGMRSMVTRCWPVMFLPHHVPHRSFGTEENPSCLEWLDQQEPCSVVYISFGSLGNISAAQMEELAFGLEATKVKFLWVMRPNLVEGTCENDEVNGMLERAKAEGRAVVTPWAPQMEVLNHRATAVFVSHCGWNSTMESIWNGVPLLVWPRFAEQNMNARLIVEEWKIGKAFNEQVMEHPWASVSRSEVEAAIGSVMRDETLRTRAREMKMAARQGTTKLKELVQAIKNNAW